MHRFTLVRQRRHLRWLGFAGLLVVLSVTLAACGSSSSSSSSSSTKTSASAGTTSADLEAAQAGYNTAITTPTTFKGPTQSVAAVKGLKVGALTCDSKLAGCTDAVKEVLAISKKNLGWSGTLYNGESSPTASNQAILQMVASNDKAIFIDSVPPAEIGQGLAAAHEKGIPVILSSGGGSTPNPVSNPSTVFAAVDINYAAAGAANANYITVESKGKANVLVLSDNSQVGVKDHVAGFQAQLSKVCPGCVQSVLQTTTADVTTKTPAEVVSYLRTHPSINWLYVDYDPQAAFIVPAMQQAGITNVPIAGILGNPQNLTFIKNGTIQVSDVLIDQTYYGYAMIDQALRAIAKQPAASPNGEEEPWYLVTKQANNLPSSPEWVAPYKYSANYLKLWGLGG